MDDDEIREIVVNSITDALDLVGIELSDTDRLGDDLGADDLDHEEVMLELEAAFDIALSDRDREGIRTVGDAINTVSSLV